MRGHRSAPVSKIVFSVLASITLLSMLAALPSRAAHAEQFGGRVLLQSYRGYDDVSPQDWYVTSGALDYSVDHGLLTGYEDGNFGPYDKITRGQVAVVLWRMAGEPEGQSQDFEDVNYDWFYGEAIRWARAAGVVSGYEPNNLFGPDDPVTREQFACMLANYAEKIAGVSVRSDCSGLDAIGDSGLVSPWAREELGWAVDNGILSGALLADGTVEMQPQANAQRCQATKMMAVLHRDVLGLDGSEGGGALPPIPEDDEGTVIVYDDALIETNIKADAVTQSGDTLAVVTDDPAAGIGVGDTVMLDRSPQMPFGAAIEVTSIAQSGGLTRVSGTRPDLEDVYDELFINEHVGYQDLLGNQIVAQSIELEEGKFTIEEDLGDIGTISGSIEINDFDGHFKINPLRWKYIDVDYDIDLTASLTYELSAVPSDVSKIKIASIPVPYMSALGCGVYVNVYVNVDLSGKLTLTADIESGLTAEKSWSSSMALDGYGDCDFSNSSEVSVEGKVGPQVVAAIQVGGWPFMDAGIEMGAEAHVETTQHPGLTCGDVGVWFYTDLLAELFGESTDELKVTRSLFDEDSSPAKLRLHAENGEVVPSCTWREDDESDGQGQGDPGQGQPSDDGYDGIPELEDKGYGSAPYWNKVDNSYYTSGNFYLDSPQSLSFYVASNCHVDGYAKATANSLVRITKHLIDLDDRPYDLVFLRSGTSSVSFRLDENEGVTIEVLYGRAEIWLSSWKGSIQNNTESDYYPTLEYGTCDSVDYPLHISDTTLTLKVGENYQLDASQDIIEIYEENDEQYGIVDGYGGNRIFSWSMPDNSVATIGPSGLITAKSPGTAYATVTFSGSLPTETKPIKFTRYCKVTVVQ